MLPLITLCLEMEVCDESREVHQHVPHLTRQTKLSYRNCVREQ